MSTPACLQINVVPHLTIAVELICSLTLKITQTNGESPRVRHVASLQFPEITYGSFGLSLKAYQASTDSFHERWNKQPVHTLSDSGSPHFHPRLHPLTS